MTKYQTHLWLLGLLLCSTVFFQDAHAANGECAWEGGPGVAQYPSCALEDCAESGGLLQCAEPDLHASDPYGNDQVPGEHWLYDTCEDGPWQNVVVFCQVAGGSWDGLRCNGLSTPFLTELRTIEETASITTADAFVQQRYNCPIATTIDTGWGAYSSNERCFGGSAAPKYRNGKLLQDYRRRDYVFGGTCQGGKVLSFTRHRQLKCQDTHTPRNRADGNLECLIPAEACCTFKGNPTSMVTGAKRQHESDYVSGGDLSLERWYNSGARYRRPGSPADAQINTDYWRHNYDRRLFPVSGNASIIAIAQRPDGTLWYFDSTGRELLNRDGAAGRLTAGGQGWLLTLGNSDVEEYDAAARLISITTRQGRRTDLTYDGGGRLATVIDSGGRQLQFNYASAGLASVTLPDGSQIAYGYDNHQRLTSITYPDSSTRSYSYEQVGHPWLLTGITDESGQRFATYTYDGNGRVAVAEHAGGANRHEFNYGQYGTGVTYPNGSSSSFTFSNVGGVRRVATSRVNCADCDGIQSTSFDANGNRASTLDARWYVTTYVHDLTRNLETLRTEGLQQWGASTANTRTTQTAWHPDFRVPTSISIYSGATATGTPVQVTSFTHDASGNILTKTISDPTENKSRTWTYTYNSSGKILTVDGPRTDVNDTTVYTYYDCATGHQCGQVETITNALGHTTTYNTYDVHGLPLTITDPNAVVTTLTYDSRQRLTSRTVGTEVSTFDYWPTGLLKKATLPAGSYLEYTYDAAHRLTDVNDSEGNRIHYTLDGLGNRTAEQVYDPSNAMTRTRSRVFNMLGLVHQEIAAAGTANVTTTYSYDNNRNQTAIAAPLGRDTGQGYDELNRLSQVTDPLNGVTHYGYNGLDQLLSVTDPKGLTTSYTYNALGDLKAQTSPDTGLTTNTYDSGGNLETSTDARNAVSTYTYDALNRVTTASFAAGSTTDQTLTYTYDVGTHGKGRLSSVTDSNHSMSWTYDAHGRVLTAGQTVGSVSKTTSYTYSNGLRQSMTTPSGQVITYGYTDGKITSIHVNGPLLVSNILYDPFGPVRQWTWSNGSLAVRTFDQDGKVMQIDSQDLKTYSYDDAFRITSITDMGDSALSWTYGYDDLDRLTSASKTDTTLGYTYDANGNRLTQTGTDPSTFTIAANSNRLSSASGTLVRTYGYDNTGNATSYAGVSFTYNNRGRMKSSTKDGVTTNYIYNALGQRVKKSSGGDAIYFVYDEAGHLIGEYDSAGELIQEIVWMDDIPVLSIRWSSCGIAIFYIHTDHLNTPRRITKRSSPDVVWRWDSDPFGTGAANEDADANSSEFAFNLRFPGQYFDRETGLYYNYYRDYDPSTGRYVQSDPIGLRGGMNTYGYVNQNPLLRVDPYGLVEWEGSSTGGAFFTAGTTYFKLKTKGCVNGKRGFANVLFIGVGLSFGADLSFSASDVTLNDSLWDVNPQIFDGDGFIANASISVPTRQDFTASTVRGLLGKRPDPNGFGCSAVRLGNAGGVGCGSFTGLEIGIGALYGSSTVLSSGVESCECGQ